MLDNRSNLSDAENSHARNFLAAKSELGKLGIQISDEWPGDRAGLLEERANLRRGLNELRNLGNEASKSGETTRFDEIVGAMNAASDMISRISNQLDMDEIAASKFNHASTHDSQIRDREGKRIGVMLSNSDLRNTSAIASRLNVDHHDGDGQAPTLSGFLRGIAGMGVTPSIRAALERGTDASGGYLTPDILMPGVLNALVPASSLLSAGANVAYLEGIGKSFQMAATDTIPTASWRDEGGNVAVSEPTFRAVTVTPQSLSFIFKISRELLQDSDVEDALRTAIAQAFAKEMDRAGLRGSGTAPEIRGLLNITGVNTLEMGSGDGLALTDYKPFISARRLIADADAPLPTAAIMSTREDESVANFADTTGQPLRRPDALKNWKFQTTSQIPTDLTVGTSDDTSEMYVGDFSNFTFFMRQAVSIQRLSELYAETGEIGFVAHARLDVAAAYPKAFTVITGARPAA